MEYQTYPDQVESILSRGYSGPAEIITRNGQSFLFGDDLETVDGPWERQHYVSLADVVLHYGRNPSEQSKPFMRARTFNDYQARYQRKLESGFGGSRASFLSRFREGGKDVWNPRRSYRNSGYKLFVRLYCRYAIRQPSAISYDSVRKSWIINPNFHVEDQHGNVHQATGAQLELRATKCHSPGQSMTIQLADLHIISFSEIYDFILGIRNTLGTRMSIYPTISKDHPYLGF